MQSNFLNWVFLILAILASTGLLVSRVSKRLFIFFFIQFFAVFWFVQLQWPLRLALIKLIIGLVVSLILFTSKEDQTSPVTLESGWPQGIFFRSLITGLVILVTITLSPLVVQWLGLTYSLGTWVGIFFMGMGLIQLGITIQPLRVVISLITFLAGFEIIYAYVESSTLVAAMLSAVNLGLAVIGGFIFTSTSKDAQ